MNRECACEHCWCRTGMFLMKEAEMHGRGGYVTGRQVVGGLVGYIRDRTPEVEWCSRCGLLRIPVIPVEEPVGQGVEYAP